MIIALLILLLLLTAISVFGYLIVLCFRHHGSIVSQLGLGFLIGSGVFSYLMLGFNTLGVMLTLSNIVGLLFGFILLLILLLNNYFLRQFKLVNAFKIPNFRFSWVEWFLLLSIIGVICSSFLINSYWPVKDWDALTLYDFRAKVYVDQGFIQNPELNAYYISYPLYTSLMHVLFYLSGVSNPMIFYSLLFMAFLAVFYDAVRVLHSRFVALFTTLLLSISPLIFSHAMIAYTNLSYTIFLTLGAIYLYLFIRLQKVSYLFIAAVLTGLSTWVRTAEPFWLANLGIVGIFVIFYFYKKFRKISVKMIIHSFILLLSYLGLFLLFQLPWRIYLLNFVKWDQISPIGQVSYGVTAVAKAIDFNHIIQVIDFAYRFTIFPILPLFLIFLFGVIYQILNRKNVFFAFIILSYIVLFFLGLYVFSSFFGEWEEIHGSLLRMSMFFSPLLIYYIATLFNERSLS